MKRLATFVCSLLLALAPLTARAEVFYGVQISPKTVKMASHIFVGEAEGFKIVNAAGQEIRHEPQMLNPKQAVEVTIRVQEVLSPANWKPAGTATVRVSGGFYSVNRIRRGLAGRKLIYLTRAISSEKDKPVFKTLYGRSMAESLNLKPKVQAIIKKQKQ